MRCGLPSAPSSNCCGLRSRIRSFHGTLSRCACYRELEARGLRMDTTRLSPAQRGATIVDLQAGRHRQHVAKPDYEDFFENTTFPLHIVGSDGTILHANRAELELLGYGAEEYIGHHIAEFYVHRPVIDDLLSRLSRGENINKYPAQMRARDGSIKHVEITSNAQFRDGQLVKTRCFTVDVTELETARKDLESREDQFKQILDGLPVVLYTTDRFGVITYCNRAAVEFAGREPKIGEGKWCVTFRLFTADGEAPCA